MKPENPFQTVIRRARKGSIEHFTDGGILYVRRYVACGKKLCSRCTIEDSNSRRPSHGPYWYMIAWNPVKKREYLLYIGKELDTKKYRTETGLIDWPAYFSIKARGKFPNTPSGPPSSGLTPDEGPQPTPEGEPPCNATE